MCHECVSNITYGEYRTSFWIMVLFATGVQKRKRTHVDDATVKKQKCHVSYSTNAPVVGLTSNLGFRGKPSMQLNMHQESSCYDVSVSEAPTSTQNGKPDLNCVTRLGKHSRPFCWQRLRRKKKKQITSEENSANTHCNLLPTNTDCLHACLKHHNTSLSYHEKVINYFCEILWKPLTNFCLEIFVHIRCFSVSNI